MKTSLLILAILFSSPAWAAKLSLVGGTNLSKPEMSPATTAYKEKEAFGGGAMLEFGFLPAIGLEFGALYLPRKFEYSVGATPQTSEFNVYQFPVLLRATLGGILSLGVGGYYAHYPDAPQVRDSLGNMLDHETSDYGVATSVAIYMPFSPISRFMIDGRYNIGVKDNLRSPREMKYNDLQILVGLQFGR